MAEDDEKRVKISVVEDSPEDKKEEDKNRDVEKEEAKPEDHSTPEKDEKVEVKEEKQKKEKVPFWIIFIAFLLGLSLGAGIIGGIFYYKVRVENMLPKESPTPEAMSTPTPQQETATPTPVSKEDKESLKIQVLNGSGIAGEASKVEGSLNDAGFTTITTGNAKSYDYTDTELSVKSSVSNELKSEIKDALSGYTLKDSDELPDSSTYDVVITVGKTKN